MSDREATRRSEDFSAVCFEVSGWPGTPGVQILVQASSEIEVARQIIAAEVRYLERECAALEKRARRHRWRDASFEKSKHAQTFNLQVSAQRAALKKSARESVSPAASAARPEAPEPKSAEHLASWFAENVRHHGALLVCGSGFRDLGRRGFGIHRIIPGEGTERQYSFGHPERYRPQAGSFGQWLSDTPSAERGRFLGYALSSDCGALDCELLRNRLHPHQVICTPVGSEAAETLSRQWDGSVSHTDGYTVFMQPGPRYLDPNLLSLEQAENVAWPKISIVLLSFNQCEFLDDALQSILAQDYPNLELIVIDGFSTDGSQELLRRYRDRIDKLLIEKDRGQSDGLNKGFNLATGDILTWINSDDMMVAGALRMAAVTFMNYDCDIVAGGCERMTENSAHTFHKHHSALPLLKRVPLGFYENLIWTRSWRRGDYFFQPEVLFTADIWRRSGGFLKEHLYWLMDWELWIRMGQAGASVVHIPEYIGRSRVHDKQKTTSEQRYLFQLKNILLEHDAVLAALDTSGLPLERGAVPGWLSALWGPNTSDIRYLATRIWRLRHPSTLRRAVARRLPSHSSLTRNVRKLNECSPMKPLLSRLRSAAFRLRHATLKPAVQILHAAANPESADYLERSLLLQGRLAANAQTPLRPIADLSEVEFRVFSQWGEDGIVEWLCKAVDVPNTHFIEFGVESFREANCRFLLQNRNWRGLVIDGSEAHMAALCQQTLHWMYDLTAMAAFVTAENIDSLITDAGFAGDLGLLSIDVDGNDYWIWKAMKSVNPAIIVCEVNPILGDKHPITIPYRPYFTRFDGHYSGLYFGASIAALRHLAAEKGYTFVGTTSTGINAFFVRNDLAGPVLALTKNIRAFPSRHRDSRDRAGLLSYVGGTERLALIKDLPVVHVETGQTLAIAELGQVYSDDWLAQIL